MRRVGTPHVDDIFSGLLTLDLVLIRKKDATTSRGIIQGGAERVSGAPQCGHSIQRLIADLPSGYSAGEASSGQAAHSYRAAPPLRAPRVSPRCLRPALTPPTCRRPVVFDVRSGPERSLNFQGTSEVAKPNFI
jgi:hypothetical protein